MTGKLFNRNFSWELPKAVKASLFSLWAFLSVIVSSVITNLLSDYLVKSPNLPQALISFWNLKLFSLSNIILIIGFVSMPLLWNESRLRYEQHSLQKKVEKDLTAFIIDVFKSHLDDKLIKIVEDAFTLNGNNCNPLYILKCLVRYFDFDVPSMTVFRPDKLGEYLNATESVPLPPSAMKGSGKDTLNFYIGSDESNADSRGLAGFTYKEREIVRIYINQKRQAFRVKKNENNQSTEESFTDYKDRRENELTYIRSIAAVPIFKNHTGSTDVLGIMCVDSTDTETFKSEKHDDKLTKAARCLAIVMEIQDLLKELY